MMLHQQREILCRRFKMNQQCPGHCSPYFPVKQERCASHNTSSLTGEAKILKRLEIKELEKIQVRNLGMPIAVLMSAYDIDMNMHDNKVTEYVCLMCMIQDITYPSKFENFEKLFVKAPTISPYNGLHWTQN